MHSSDSLEASPTPRRRRYDPHFKAELVAYCQQRGISVASVARDHGINANLVRRWIQEHERYGDLDVSTTSTTIHPDVAAQFIAVPTAVSKPIERLLSRLPWHKGAQAGNPYGAHNYCKEYGNYA